MVRDEEEDLLHEAKVRNFLASEVEKVVALLEFVHPVAGVVESGPVHLRGLVRVDGGEKGPDAEGEAHPLWVNGGENRDRITEQGVGASKHGLNLVTDECVR